MARILIIDDDDIIRRMLSLMLTKAGYDVVAAADGKEGLKQFRENTEGTGTNTDAIEFFLFGIIDRFQLQVAFLGTFQRFTVILGQ